MLGGCEDLGGECAHVVVDGLGLGEHPCHVTEEFEDLFLHVLAVALALHLDAEAGLSGFEDLREHRLPDARRNERAHDAQRHTGKDAHDPEDDIGGDALRVDEEAREQREGDSDPHSCGRHVEHQLTARAPQPRLACHTFLPARQSHTDRNHTSSSSPAT